jgi:NADPH:quinone reductase-like Zn-dependent oxidoreductase
MPASPLAMNAVLLTGHGGLDRLIYRDDVPTPIPGLDEVLLRVRAAAVNNTDINMRVGWYSKGVTESTGTAVSADSREAESEDSGWSGGSMSFPLIQGADVCGHIVAVGSAVQPARIGQRVLVDPVLRSRRTAAGLKTLYLGSDCDGAFADYVCVPAINAHSIKTSLSDAELASFPCSYTAAENMLSRAAVREGETVLITGASGGVGSAAVQLAKRRGAHVIAIAGGSKMADVAELGASQVLPRDADLEAALGDESVDAVIDVVGGPQFAGLLRVLRRGCRYAVAGAIAGPLVTLDLRTLYLKDLRLLGCTISEPEVFASLVRYIEGGEIRPVVARTYAMRAIADAQRDFLAKRHLGKIVLMPEGG